MLLLRAPCLRTRAWWPGARCFVGAQVDEQQQQQQQQQQQKQKQQQGQHPVYTITQRRSRGREASLGAAGTPEHGFTFTECGMQHAAQLGGTGTNIFRHLLNMVKGVLLPAGFPASVGPGYLEFSLLQGLTNVAMTANSVVASTFMLYAVGLGTGAGIATAGALNWVLKDGLGQLGTLAFGKVVNHQFDCHSKTWFFLSAVMLKAATGVEIATVLFPTHFLVLGTVANSLKGLAWMASSSTRSVFMLSFVRDSNLADLTAKSTSQWICASIVGTVVGAWICAGVGQDPHAAAAAYVALTALTLLGALATVKTVALPTLNTTRLQLLCEEYLGLIGAAAASQQLQRRAQLASTFGPDSLLSHLTSAHAHLPNSTHSGGGSSSGHTYYQPEGLFAGAGFSGGLGQHTARQQPAHALLRQHQPVAALHAAGGVFGGGTGRVAGAAEGGTRRGGAIPGGGWACGWDAAGALETMLDEFLDPALPSPPDLASEDPPLPFLLGDQRLLDPAIVVGEALERVFEDMSPEMVVLCVSTFRLSRALVLPRGPAVHILLHHEATPKDVCQAYLQACLLRRRIRAGSTINMAVVQHAAEVQARAHQAASKWQHYQQHQQEQERQEQGCKGQQQQPPQQAEGREGGSAAWMDELPQLSSSSQALAELRIVLQDTLQTAERLTSPFLRSLEAAGWKLDKVLVEGHKRRARW